MSRIHSILKGTAMIAVTCALAATPVLAQTTGYGQNNNSGNPAMPATETSQTAQPMTQPTNGPASPSSRASLSNAVALSAVNNPKTTLASAVVQDASGRQVGQVQAVKTNSSGQPVSVDVGLTSTAGTSKTVAIRASKLRYSPSNNLLMTTDLTASQIEAMPAVNNP
jgi:hypothetical protein